MSSGLRRLKPLLFGALACLLGLGVPALADPPARVGRLSAIAGTVSFHDSGDTQWSPAALNYPVTSGNAFWTEPGARAEIRIGSTAIHLDGSTELDITALDDRRFDATLAQGTVNIRVPRFDDGDGYTIATPRGTVILAAPGTYRIFAGTDRDPTQVAVLEGAARVVDRNSTVSLSRGEEALLSGTDTIDYQITEAQPTPFDNESLAGERREEQVALPAARYVSPEMTGYEDLDEHGVWRSDPTYGPVWYPQAVPVDWAPYRYGHWRWIAPWGWTWIDDQPWGFAPFHYGRWAYIGDRWGWTPGTMVARPVYAPALVAFVGGGWSLSLTAGGGPAVGWFPLAPREVYVPSYPASVTYVRNVNITNVTNVTNITNQTISNVNVTNVRHANRQFATVVPQEAFVRAQPTGRTAIAVPRDKLDRAPVATAAPLTAAVAAASGHQEAVRRATRVAEAQGQRIDGPTPQAVPLAANASPAAPGPAIAHGGRREDKHTQPNPSQQPGQPQPMAQAQHPGQPQQAGQAPQAGQPQQAAQAQQPFRPPLAARPERNAPVWSRNRPAASTAAPGPPIAPHERAQARAAAGATSAGISGQNNSASGSPAPGNVAKPSPPAVPTSAHPQASGMPPNSRVSPPAAAAPGPPIQSAGRSGAGLPPLRPHDTAASSGTKPPIIAQESKPSSAPSAQPAGPMARAVPGQPVVAAREPARHMDAPRPAAPQPAVPPAGAAQARQTAQGSPPAPTPPGRTMARSVQQPAPPPTHQAWSRAPAPQPQQAAPQPATPPARATQPRQTVQSSVPAPRPPERIVPRPVQQPLSQPTHQASVRPPAPQSQQAAAPHPQPQQAAPHAAPPQKAAAPAPTQPPTTQRGNDGHPSAQPDQKHVNG